MIATFYPQNSDIFKIANNLTDGNRFLTDIFQLTLILGTSGDMMPSPLKV